MGELDGAVARALASHQCVLGSIPGPGVLCGLSLLLVLYSAPRGFSPGTPVFPSPQKPTFPNSNSIWIIVKHFIMSLWLWWSSKHSLCLTLNLHLHSTMDTVNFKTFKINELLDGKLKLAIPSLLQVYGLTLLNFSLRKRIKKQWGGKVIHKHIKRDYRCWEPLVVCNWQLCFVVAV